MARIFVVDDEPDMVDLLATILKSDGFQVDTDTDGRSALARLLAEPPATNPPTLRGRTIKTSTAITMIAGTKTAATRSASAWIGALLPWAS